VLSLLVFLPLAGAVLVTALPRLGRRAVLALWLGVSAAELVLATALWARSGPTAGITGGFVGEERARWLPGVASSYHVGVDGLSLPLVGLTAGLFLACAVYSVRHTDRLRAFAALCLLLETTCLGLFVALDLVLFFVFFDASIAVMYFLIAGWGHAGARSAALRFFLYTFLGSLLLLVGFIGLYLAASPHTFDIVGITRANPLAGRGTQGALVLFAIGIGLAVKTPVVPFHTWLPPAHTEAPTVGSVLLAGVLLKMGAYGFLRVAMPLLPGSWRSYAVVVVAVGVLSVLWGALVALAQTSFKRMIAYTSVNHMGYVVLAVGAAGIAGGTAADTRAVAVTGAVTQMVSHGLLTGGLFFLSGVLYERGGSYEMGEYGGLAAPAPRFAGLTAVAAFASLGLPGFSGFVAEFQIFAGSLGPAPAAVGFALLGIVVTAALLLLAVQRVFLGSPARSPRGPVADLTWVETAAVLPLVALSVAVGVLPRFLLDAIEPAARALTRLVAP